MVEGSFKPMRDKCIESLNSVLSDVCKVAAPRWIMVLIMIPFFTWEAIKLAVMLALRTVATAAVHLFKALITPLIGLYVFVDMVVIMFWFFKRALDKMTGEAQ